MTNTEKFCQLLRKRSQENKKSFDLLFESELYGNCISVLRQELDSMIRVIFLLQGTELDQRDAFIQQTLNGEQWSFINQKGKKQRILDSDMVNLADKLNGWTRNVYEFGCAFIHLSNLHDYHSEHPFTDLEDSKKNIIIRQLKQYHEADVGSNSRLEEIIQYLPSVMEKINSNYIYEIDFLEKGVEAT